ncbi:uncharacterized protein HaLaN_28988, partial [Haematococcus lacustris]
RGLMPSSPHVGLRRDVSRTPRKNGTENLLKSGWLRALYYKAKRSVRPNSGHAHSVNALTMLQSQPPQGDSKGSVSSLWTRMASSIGPTWILVGMLTWSVLNWQAQYWLHTPAALEQMREQVPMQVYDRSTFLFLTALVMDVLNILFERQTTKLDYVLLPAFVKGMATTSNMVVRFGTPTVAFTTLGRPFMVQRYVCWAHTTPTLLMLVRLISSSISDTQFFTAVAWDETMLLTGVLALVTTGWLQGTPIGCHTPKAWLAHMGHGACTLAVG